MGRDVKRVPLDFDWPLKKVWQGYLTPDRFDEEPCPAGEACLSGKTAARAWVEQIASMLLMLDTDRRAQQRERPMHPYFASVPKPWRSGEDLLDRMRNPDPRVPRPSADIAEFGTGLAGREAGFLGHDAVDRWRAEEAVIRAAGLDPDKWGICPECEGHGNVEAYEGQRAEAEAWTCTEPPSGEGWQLWETVSEGSPVSPVFPDAEGLARWLTTPEGGEMTGPSRRSMTIEQARGFISQGWAPSGIVTAGGVHDGAEYIGSRSAVGDLFDQ